MPDRTDTGVSSQRLEFFTDGVLAVAITLLVLRINPPNPGPGQSMWDAFTHQTVPQIVYFLITFAVIVRLWRHHHDIFRHTTGDVTQRQMTLNMACLAAVCLLPFGLEFYSTDAASMLTTSVYAGLLAIAILLMGWLGWIVTHQHPVQAFWAAGVFLLAIPLTPLVGSWALMVWLVLFPASRIARRFVAR